MKTNLFFAVLATLIVGCGGHSEPKPVPPADTKQFDDVANALPPFYDKKFVVSLAQDGTPDSLGDALIWSGEALYALDCARGATLADGIADMLSSTNGKLYRHPDLPDEATFDGATGMYRGIAKRVVVCGEAERWKPLIAAHIAYLAANNNKFNAADSNASGGAYMPNGFDYVLAKLAAAVGLRDQPTSDARLKLEAEVGGWAGAVMAAHAACYRLNLGLVTLQTIEELGDHVSAAGRDGPLGFCTYTRGSRIPTIDHWCGRESLGDWLPTWKRDEWEFRHQRCPAWEDPDGKGLRRPGVDLLVGWADYHGSPR